MKLNIQHFPIEKVARAIASSDWLVSGGNEKQAVDAYDLINNNGRFMCDEAARAAIEIILLLMLDQIMQKLYQKTAD